MLGFVSDAHGNADGLAACLDLLQRAGVDRVYFLGDSLGYMPDEDAVLRRLRADSVACIRGNHEEMLLGHLPLPPENDEVYRIGAVRQRLSAVDREWIAQWPVQRDVEVNGTRLRLIHGSPADPRAGYLHEDTPLEFAPDAGFDVLVCGHTHRPFIRTVGSVTVVNAGSVGLPRDVGHLASCATYDPQSGRAEILRVAFDAESLVQRFRDRIHPAVIDVLRREPASGSPVGRAAGA